MTVKLGDIVITKDCVTDSEGLNEHPALVTKIYSSTKIDCVIFMINGANAIETIGEKGLLLESASPSGKRFVEKIV